MLDKISWMESKKKNLLSLLADTITADYRPRENVIPYISENKNRPQFDE